MSGNWFRKVPLRGSIIAFLIVATFLIYFQTLSFGFLNFDDGQFVTENEVVSSDASSFADCFRYKFGEHDYFPLTYAFFRLLRMLFGFNPVVFHATNLLFHIANVVLIFFLCMRILAKFWPARKNNELSAAIIAFIFSFHPIHVESVSWVIDLKDMLFTFFYLSALLLYWKWIEDRKIVFYYLAFFLALLSMLSKSTAITFVAALFWVDLVIGRKGVKDIILEKIPFFLLTLTGFYIFGLFTNPGGALLGLTGGMAEGAAPYFPASVASLPVFLQRIVIASFRLGFWIMHSVFPFELNLFLMRSVLLEKYALLLPFIPFLLVAGFSGIWLLRKKTPLMLYGLAFLLITLSPAFAKSDVGISIFVPDRYMYLPLLGLLLVLSGLLVLFQQRVRWGLLIVFSIFWGWRTIDYLPVWKNNYTLYDYCLSLNPESSVPRLNRAMSYFKEGKNKEALIDFDFYIKHFPYEDTDAAYLNRGAILASQGDTASAMNDFQAVLRSDPKNTGALLNCGNIYLAKNELDNAREYFSTAYDIDSTNYLLNKKIASLYNKAGNHPVALRFAEKCHAQDAGDIDVLRLLGVSNLFVGNLRQAIDFFSEVIDKEDKYPDLWYYRAMAYFGIKDYSRAKSDVEEAKRRNVKCDPEFEKKLYAQ